jgi:hypothetical protein
MACAGNQGGEQRYPGGVELIIVVRHPRAREKPMVISRESRACPVVQKFFVIARRID